jgi:hypothetical protein
VIQLVTSLWETFKAEGRAQCNGHFAALSHPSFARLCIGFGLAVTVSSRQRRKKREGMVRRGLIEERRSECQMK